MANEIAVLDGDGAGNYNLLFLFPIATPKQAGPVDGPTTNVVPTKSSTLSTMAWQVTSTAEKSALDAGTLMFRIVSFKKDTALTNPQLVAKVQQIYASQLAVALDWYDKTYQHVGTRVNAP